MQKAITKDRAKKLNIKIYAILGAVATIIGSLWFLHYKVVKFQNPRWDINLTINTAFTHIITHPFEIFPLNGDDFITIFIALACIAFVIFSIMVESKEKRVGDQENIKGSAHFMNGKEYEKYCLELIAPLKKPETNGFNNMILSKDLKLAIDGAGTRKNCNILVIGGSGAGKSRFFAAPNILQYNSNFVITDPSGEMLRDYGKALENAGYEVLVFNLVDVYRSNRYNPFHYIQEEKDVFTLVNTLIKNTTPEGKGGGDPFWEKSENLLLTALMLYLWHTEKPENRTFTNVLRLLDMAKIDENDDTAESPLDILFEDLRKRDKDNLAVKQYDKFKVGAGKTLKSILISVSVRLQSFDLADIKYLTSDDDFHFETFSDTKKAIFVIIPTADTTFNFIVSMLYSQLFASLYVYAETRASFGWKVCIDEWTNITVEQAENANESNQAKKRAMKLAKDIKAGTKIVKPKKGDPKKLYKVYTINGNKLVGWRGSLKEAEAFQKKLEKVSVEKCSAKCPNHVRLILDEFANIGQIPDFDQKLATMRKYEISCSIILQALSQLKQIYEKQWNTIVANCDTKLFLGCDDSETIEWILKMLGKETTKVRGTSQSAKGQGSTSINRDSRELMTIDQVTMMAADECLVRVRGVRPYFGKKYELTEHPNYEKAHKLSGTFYIPISESIKKGRDLKKPLLERDLDEANNKKEITDSVGKVKEARNEANKNNAENNKKVKKEDIEDAQLTYDFLCENTNINSNMSKTEIKEQLESIILLEDIPGGALNFTVTD